MSGVILIVEDHEGLRCTLAKILSLFGYETLEAATGHDAIEKTSLMKPNLVLMDFSLPDMTGAEAAHVIKNNPVTGTIPVIGCSAYFGAEYRDAALISGMVDYLVKPVSVDLITAKIAKFLEER